MESLTEAGASHIRILRLNRPMLIERRLRRRLDEMQSVRRELLEAENARLREMVGRLTRLILLPISAADTDDKSSKR